MPRMVSLRKRFAELIPELAKFGLVGLVGSVVDLGGAAYLHGAVGIGPMVSKGLSIIAATVLTYLGSRFWTFRHRVNQALLREGVLFAALNIVGLAIAECVIAFVTYGLDLKGTLAYNAASLAGTGLGTIFRYFSYKKWVFLAGVPGAAVAAGEAAVSGFVDATETSETGALLAGTADEPSFEHEYGPSWELLDTPCPLPARGAASYWRFPPGFRPDRGPAGWPSAAGSWAGRPRTWRASA
jgi:putative flippase GtrA